MPRRDSFFSELSTEWFNSYTDTSGTFEAQVEPLETPRRISFRHQQPQTVLAHSCVILKGYFPQLQTLTCTLLAKTQRFSLADTRPMKGLRYFGVLFLCLSLSLLLSSSLLCRSSLSLLSSSSLLLPLLLLPPS